jgi:tRNA modification GTPase
VGVLGRLYEGWRETLLQALGRVEAEIDFAPEEDVPEDLLEVIRPDVARLSAEIAAHLVDGHRGERLRAGLTVAVVGPPNAGKSSLVNRLARRDVAIVTPLPGTTRDVLEVHLDLAGYPVTLLDTAGLREAADLLEAEGVRARGRAPPRGSAPGHVRWRGMADLDGETLAMVDDAAVLMLNKCDLQGVAAPICISSRAAPPLSCLTGEGIAELLDMLAERRAPAGDSDKLS